MLSYHRKFVAASTLFTKNILNNCASASTSICNAYSIHYIVDSIVIEREKCCYLNNVARLYDNSHPNLVDLVLKILASNIMKKKTENLRNNNSEIFLCIVPLSSFTIRG